MDYTKIALDTPDLLAMLKQRGLLVDNEQKALQTLSSLSYFRLACYFRPMEIDKQTHEFRKGTTLDHALALYKFDTALRDMVFGATRQIEVALRSRVNHHFSRNHTPFWFTQVDMAIDGHLFVENLANVDREIHRTKEDFIKEWLTVFKFPPDKIYPQLCCIAYLLNAIDAHNTFSKDLKRLLKKYPSVDVAAMGFPKRWKKEPLWK